MVYNGYSKWTAPRTFLDLFKDQKELAKQIFLEPYQLIDIQRTPDLQFKTESPSGIVPFVLKNGWLQDIKSFLEQFLPWINQIEVQMGTKFAGTVLRYVFDRCHAEDREELMSQSKQYLSSGMQEDYLTLPDYYREEGREEGHEEGLFDAAKRLLKRGMSALEVSNLLELPLENINKLTV